MPEIVKDGVYRLQGDRLGQRYSIGIDFEEIDGLGWQEARAFFDGFFSMVPVEGRELGVFSAQQAEDDYDGYYTNATLEFVWDVPETDEEFAERTRKETAAAKRAAEANRKTVEQRERTLLAKLKEKYES